MFIPSLNVADPSQAALKTAVGYLGSALIEEANVDAIKALIQETGSTFYWAQADNVDQAVQLWDAGVYKVVFSVDTLATAADELNGVSEERIAVQGSLVSLSQLTQRPSTYIVETSIGDALNTEALHQFADSVRGQLLPQGAERRVVVNAGSDNLVTLDAIAKLDAVKLDVLVSAAHLTVQEEEQGKINIGQAFLATATTDRADGLFTTMVVDERNTALGLVYSSVKSVAESIKTGQGVYQSRNRGLWYKGATSGATQSLVRIDCDCDGDALRFVVKQHGAGFCHLNTRTCFGADTGLSALQATLQSRKESAPAGSYTARLFNDSKLLRAKIMEEAEELCDATAKDEVAWEAADLIYFALTKCVSAGVSLEDVEKNLDKKARKVTRRPGNAKPKWSAPAAASAAAAAAEEPKKEEENGRIAMETYDLCDISTEKRSELLLRPIIDSTEIIGRVTPIMKDVRKRGDAALVDLTAKFDRVQLERPTLKAPFDEKLMQLDPETKAAIDQAYDNIFKFHDAQMDRDTLTVETMPGVVCTRFARPIERVGLYVPGGTAVLPSTTLMLGIPAKVAGCSEIVIATPPRPDGSVVPEVLYVAHKVGASHVLLAGGAQAVAAMAYGTQTVPKVDKICGPGNQYVTAAKMVAQNDTSCLVSIDMPAGPSEVLVIADKTSNPAYTASDLLSQAEHGVDSQVVLVAVDLTDAELAAIEDQIHIQASRLPRVDIVRQSIPKSYTLKVKTLDEAVAFSNDYAPEHLILHNDNPEDLLPKIMHAGSVFVGPYSPESCGDYASGTNHTLPTYGYSRMYSGVNTLTFVKHITSQQLTADGLNRLGDTVMRLAEIEGLEAHRNAVAIRIADLRK
ncbi:histidinol dehydrogenase-domain-containing protein [Zychaea mexicana]|uniref:histidinol dehydrogenase-domain-containing protein n=1 Tax=Zychaea mexicana TaxID=64656 RepID=UPI0022FF22C5|nr:histidinol dehydrogenase-domain-containing protein [Zychaea mexicana]KAI9498697.1 histidinol dehydrogenase-domain-containing protein [Zychaea mexicana]